MKEFHRKYPDIILGLSDHTPGHATVLGAVTLERVIEKHFANDIKEDLIINFQWIARLEGYDLTEQENWNILGGARKLKITKKKQ